MKYVVFEEIINKIVENNIEIDKETFSILLNIKNFNLTAKELLEKIMLDDSIKDKKKFLNYMIKINENTGAMKILLKILNDENIRENDNYIRLIMYKFDDIAREYVLESIKTNKMLENQEILDFVITQPELIQRRILICLKSGINNEQLERLMKTKNYKMDEVLKEIENEILEKTKNDLEDIINKVSNNPSIDKLKELQLKQEIYNNMLSIFKVRTNGKVETEIEIDENKRLILVNNLPNNKNK